MSPAPRKGLSESMQVAEATTGGRGKPLLTLEEYRRAITPAAQPSSQAATRAPSNPPPAPSSRSQSASSARRERHTDPFFAKIDPTDVTYKPARSVVSAQLVPPAQICVRRNAYGVLDSYTEEVTLFHLRQFAERSSSVSEIGTSVVPDWHKEPLKVTKEPPKAWRKDPPAYLASRPTPRSLHIRQSFVETQRKKAERPQPTPKIQESVEDSLLYGPPVQPPALAVVSARAVTQPAALSPTAAPQANNTSREPPAPRHAAGSPPGSDRRFIAPAFSPQRNDGWNGGEELGARSGDVEVSPPTPAALRARQVRPAATSAIGDMVIPSMRFARPDLFQGLNRQIDEPSPSRHTPAAILEHLELQLQRRSDIPSRPPPPEPHVMRTVPAQPRLDGADSVHDAAENAKALLAQLTSRPRYPVR